MTIPSYSGTLTWFLPGLAVSVLVGLAVAGPMARALREPKVVVFLLVVAFGAILSATLTPIEPDPEVAQGLHCDLSRLGLASVEAFRTLNDTSLNVALFIPLGVAIGLLRPSPHKAFLGIAAVALPLAIEGLQPMAAVLGRGCESGDVIDNLTGLVIGIAVGTAIVALGLLGSRVTSRPSA